MPSSDSSVSELDALIAIAIVVAVAVIRRRVLVVRCRLTFVIVGRVANHCEL